MRKYFLLLCVVASMLFACKKDSKHDSIIGGWEQSEHPLTSRHLTFGSNGKFSMTTSASGFIYTQTILSGTYQTNKDNLIINITEQTEIVNNKPVVTPVTNMQLYDKATFKVRGDELILKYTTYPADAPVATETKFSRILPD